MNVHIERDWLNDGYSISFFERHPTRVMRRSEQGIITWESVDDGADPVEPTFRLPADALEALLAEAEKVIPASHATERHLTDAVAVRDRLLALVEEGWSHAEVSGAD
jgi:hypothetical protein